jgi:2-polyprenyl-3-methyl-5-hydroxy-6-metoxy-1,4-benzoquinol methylase
MDDHGGHVEGMTSAVCPDCSTERVMLIGSIPATDVFAGRSLEHPLPGGSLYRCGQCCLGFRWPRPSKTELDKLYASGNELTWTAGPHSRPDWRIARAWVSESVDKGGRILDIGCFDGGFMEPLIKNYHCSGIEIHPVARERAQEKGLELIGSDFSAVVPGTLDCITAFDVIEHMESPKSFVENCFAALEPGGWLLVSTGNLDAFSFRLMGSRYWYCTIAEHISFVSPKWFSILAEDLGYQTVKQAAFSHADASLLQHVQQSANNILYRTSGSSFRLLRKLGMGGKDVKAHPKLLEHPPGWMSARDHFMILVQKR